ncbi:MAG TPA: GNAT family N-acetyltransferase [Desulfomonilaceae bacterium]|nr:GNAT family N-acetyltransferase [Desulfomonilaceae bacterium]
MPESSDDFRTPYPKCYQTKAFTRDGSEITIRPITPEDAPLLVEFFNVLSKLTIFFRFLRGVKYLTPKWIKRFTRINYARDVAMVAVEETEDRERIWGVCRIMRQPETTTGEVAVVVGDAWQRRGIGTILVEHSISIARELGIRSIWGIVSPENRKMLAMANRLGFSVQLDAEAGVYEIKMELSSGVPVSLKNPDAGGL